MNKIIKKNFVSLISFEIIVSLIALYAISPVIKLLFNVALKVTGYSYLTQENAMAILFNPLVIVLIFIGLFVVTFFTLLEIFALNVFYIAAKRGEKLNLLGVFSHLKSKSPELMSNRNIFLFVHAVIILPFSGIIYTNPVLLELRIPNFILDSLVDNSFAVLALSIISTLGFFFAFYNSYTFLFILSEGEHYFKAVKSSVSLVNRTKMRIFWAYVKISFYSFLWWLLIFAIQSAFYLLSNAFKGAISFSIFSILVNAFRFSVLAVFDTAVKVLGVYAISEVYYSKLPLPKLSGGKNRDIKLKKLLTVLILAIVLTVSALGVLANIFEDVPHGMAVMAHRGSSVRALENSKEAIMLAVDEGAKYVELDVVLSRDKVPVVFHDLNVKRLAGEDRLVSDMDLDELSKLKLRSANGKEGKISTLAEIVESVGDKAVLNVELKPNKYNVDELVNSVESVLKGKSNHMVCSLNSAALKEYKLLNPKRKAGLIMAVAFGNYEKADFLDFYSIEESFVNKKVVDKIHDAGKRVFVWTVNDLDDIGRYFDMRVDGIITDYPKESLSEITLKVANYHNRHIEKFIFGN